jgi:truncated hemoglobin YjbI
MVVVLVNRMREYFRNRYKATTTAIRSWTKIAKRKIRVGYAHLWHRFYFIRSWLTRLLLRHSGIAIFSLLIVLFTISAFWLPETQVALQPNFATTESLGSFRSLILTIGGALIGATAIAFTLVMFAIQVNIERMPHGLFRKLSSDRYLLGAFGITFLLAITIATLSMIPDKSWVAVAVYGTVWGTFLVLGLFLYAYRRALSLINPIQQLNFIVEATQKDFRRWVRNAQHAAPILEEISNEHADPTLETQSTYDLERFKYFQINPHWSNQAQNAILHAITFARRYAEDGDYEVSGAALTAIVGINAGYIEAKGKTFVAQNPLINNSLSTDGFINVTLEHLRQNLHIGVERGDENQIEQTLQTIAQLAKLYLRIDYSQEFETKTHANLAASYLSGSAKSILPKVMPDVLMEWMRLMGQTAQLFILQADHNDIRTLTERIGMIAGACATKDDYRPVTQVGVEQLTNLTKNLIYSEHHDVRYALEDVKRNINFIAEFLFAVPETLLNKVLSTNMGPYYSGTTPDSFLQWLTDLAHALSENSTSDERCQNIIRKIEEWAQSLSKTEKELFLLSIKNKSFFTFDIIHWISSITKLLLFISNTKSCPEHTREELKKHALWLVSVLTWIPDNNESVRHVENFSVTEILFDVALDSNQREFEEFSLQVGKILLSWGFKGGKYGSGWGTLDKSIYGLAALAIIRKEKVFGEQLKKEISNRQNSKDAVGQEICDIAARNIRDKAATLYQQGYSHSRIDNVMHSIDHEQLAPLLNEIADILSPPVAE